MQTQETSNYTKEIPLSMFQNIFKVSKFLITCNLPLYVGNSALKNEICVKGISLHIFILLSNKMLKYDINLWRVVILHLMHTYVKCMLCQNTLRDKKKSYFTCDIWIVYKLPINRWKPVFIY